MWISDISDGPHVIGLGLKGEVTQNWVSIFLEFLNLKNEINTYLSLQRKWFLRYDVLNIFVLTFETKKGLYVKLGIRL